MAQTTDPQLRQKIMYSIFVRNHTKEGTFRSVIPDLPRIKALGVDIVWLLPIHPIGKVSRKGAMGCPYAIQDYRAVNPEYGTLEDFKALVDAIHDEGMKAIIDVVYNHTSPDSVLWNEHPEYFYRTPEGKPGNHVGEWTDIIDLDYTVEDLWDYQIETLCYWAQFVDGFRCDVASLVPVAFWKRARAAVEKVRPGAIWLAETVHASFGEELRSRGLYCATDAEDYEAFDIEYEYDIREEFEDVLKGKKPLSAWTACLNHQEEIYPANYDKLRFCENHDMERIASLFPCPKCLKSLTALAYYLKGTTLVYGGQEIEATNRPSLFDKDSILWDWKRAELESKDLSALMARMAEISHEVLDGLDSFHAEADDEERIVVAQRRGVRPTTGIFPLRARKATVAVDVPDGRYENLIDHTFVEVKDGRMETPGTPCIIEA